MRARRSLAVAVLVALPVAAGCGVGKGSETEHERTTPYVANASVGTMLVRDALFLPAVTRPPATSASTAAQAYVSATLLNTGSTPDTLSGVTAGSGLVQPTGIASGSLTINPGGTLRFGDPDISPGPALEVVGLGSAPVVGTAVAVTFTFQNAGTVRVLVPVRDPTTIGTTATATPIPYTGTYPTLASQVPEAASPPPSESPTP